MNPSTITVKVTISSDEIKVWDYYTAPEHITQWNFANDDWCCPSVNNELSVGGKYVARMEAKDGSFGFDFEAVYNEVSLGEKLKYTMSDGRQVTVLFRPLSDAVEVKVTFDADNENPLDMQEAGWQAILDNFKKYVEGH